MFKWKMKQIYKQLSNQLLFLWELTLKFVSINDFTLMLIMNMDFVDIGLSWSDGKNYNFAKSGNDCFFVGEFCDLFNETVQALELRRNTTANFPFFSFIFASSKIIYMETQLQAAIFILSFCKILKDFCTPCRARLHRWICANGKRPT